MDLTPAKTSLPIVRANRRIMAASWTPKGVRGLAMLSPVLLSALALAIASLSTRSILTSNEISQAFKVFLLALNATTTVIIVAQFGSFWAAFKPKNPVATEARNRALFDLVSKGTDWSPHALALILIGVKQGHVDIYDGSAEDAQDRLRLWFKNRFDSDDIGCSLGHLPICSHRTPDLHRWMNGLEPIHKPE